MRLINYFLIFIFCFSCGNNNNIKKTKNKAVNENIKTNENLSINLETRLKNQVFSVLDINNNEKAEYKIYFEKLNNDSIKDAIITVNRLENAINSSANEKNISKRAELGYLGPHNFFFYYDGKSDRLSIPITIASSAKTPLKVEFINLESESYKNITIEYRIRNSAFKNFYLLSANELKLVFQWKMYDKLGNDDYEAYFLDYTSGKYSLVKDIIIYRGIIKNYSKNIENVYLYNPIIENSKEKFYTFFYEPNKMKYATFDKPKTNL